MEPEALDCASATLIRAVRERRLAEGLSCPRCGATRVVRWGRFSGRQRYRCRRCLGCFSDLTATPLAYLKRLDAWPSYFRSLNASRTVRQAAGAARVSVSTSFRWRHLILEAISALETDCTPLLGSVEFAQTRFPHSAKGCWRGRPANASYARYAKYGAPGCWVVVAKDRSGGHRAEPIFTGVLNGYWLNACFDDLLPEGIELYCDSGRFGRYGLLQWATPNGMLRRVVRVSGACRPSSSPYHNRNARRWIAGLRSWMRRFHGVATHYLPSYVAWRRLLDLVEEGPWLAAVLPFAAPPRARQQVPQTESEGTRTDTSAPPPAAGGDVDSAAFRPHEGPSAIQAAPRPPSHPPIRRVDSGILHC